MQDIRKPYSHSKSDRILNDKVEAFEKHSYDDEDKDDRPVSIPVRKSFKERRSVDGMEMFPSRGRRAYDQVNPVSPSDRRHTGEDIVYRDPRTRYERKKQSLGTLLFIVSLLIILIGGSLLTFVFNRAKVTITPKHADLTDFRQPITFSQADSDNKLTVLYVVASTSLSKTRTLSASESKKVESKASGKIVIYNNYSSEPQRLIKNTRFESTSGKIYRINQSVTVPGMSGAKPGSVEAVVFADGVGSDYNSSPSDFTIPGFKGSPQYDKFYARSAGPLTGGASGTMSTVSQADINAAKDELALELAQELKTALMKQKMEGYIGLYSALDVLFEDNEPALLAGTTSSYEVIATGYLMFAKGDELAQSVAHTVRDYKNEPVRLDNTELLTYTRKDSDKLSVVQSLELLVEGSPRVVFLTDEEGIKKIVAGKKRSDFASLMKTVNSIEGAEISFSPLWLSTFPEDTSKISVVESLPRR